MKILALMLLVGLALGAEEVSVTEISPTLLLFGTSAGNVLTSIGPDGALMIGTPSASSTKKISAILNARTKSSLRYLVVAPESVDTTEGDAGWQKLGAFAAMHEKALNRLGGHAMGPLQPLPAHLISLGVDRPRIAFSEVITFDMNGDSIHVVHQQPGFSDADSVVHVEVANIIYLGEVFPGDGYPLLDTRQGANLDGILHALEHWSGGAFRIAPARGKLTDGTALRSFHDMIFTVRSKVQQSLSAGASVEQVVAQHPAAAFDAQWGHGRVTSDDFVRSIYNSLSGR